MPYEANESNVSKVLNIEEVLSFAMTNDTPLCSVGMKILACMVVDKSHLSLSPPALSSLTGISTKTVRRKLEGIYRLRLRLQLVNDKSFTLYVLGLSGRLSGKVNADGELYVLREEESPPSDLTVLRSPLGVDFNDKSLKVNFGAQSSLRQKTTELSRACKETWNTTLKGLLQEIKLLSHARVLSVRKTVGLLEEADLSYEDFCKKIKASSFLTGGNKSGWRATFDWAHKASNAVKIIEGNYDDRGPNQAAAISSWEQSMHDFFSGVPRD